MAAIDRQVQETLAFLAARYPVFTEIKPLAVGTYDQLVERHPEIEPRIIRFTLTRYCARPRYLKAVARSTERYDLNGNPVGEVTEEHREKAKAHFEIQREQQRAAHQRWWEGRQHQREAARRKAKKLRQAEEAIKAKGEEPARKPQIKTIKASSTGKDLAQSPNLAGLGRPKLTLKPRPKHENTTRSARGAT